MVQYMIIHYINKLKEKNKQTHDHFN
jgi:hypothetical protein